MNNSKELLEQRGALVEELETILDTVAAEERDFSDAENTRQDAIHAEVGELDAKIKRAKSNEAVFAAAYGAAVSTSEESEKQQIRGRFSLGKAISDIVNKGQLDGVELEMTVEGRDEMSKSGASARGNLTIPSFLMGEARANETYTVDDTTDRTKAKRSAVLNTPQSLKACALFLFWNRWVRLSFKRLAIWCCHHCQTLKERNLQKSQDSPTSMVTSET